eukprot:GHVP01000210.1.p1 GENE.GHVP01000210.1~~GHVP01000210.1.p1  ORF type:complete len:179 (-),score=29.31 GHVP01000210.1:53-589(-)
MVQKLETPRKFTIVQILMKDPQAFSKKDGAFVPALFSPLRLESFSVKALGDSLSDSDSALSDTNSAVSDPNSAVSDSLRQELLEDYGKYNGNDFPSKNFIGYEVEPGVWQIKVCHCDKWNSERTLGPKDAGMLKDSCCCETFEVRAKSDARRTLTNLFFAGKRFCSNPGYTPFFKRLL